MSQAERISRIHFLLRAKGLVTLEELKDTFEVSRATLMRDIELMRDRLGAPLIYDAKENGYRYDEKARSGELVDELPGLWLSAKEGYAFLTLFNVLRAIDPGFLMYFLLPMRRTLKRLLTSHDFTMWRLDEKVVIELSGFSRVDSVHVVPLFSALVTDEVVRLRWKGDGPEEHEADCRVTQLRLKETGWRLAIKPAGRDIVVVRLEDIQQCLPLA